ALEQRANAGVEHFHTQKVVVRPGLSDFLRGFAHTEADLQHGGRLPAEYLAEIQLCVAIGQGPQRQQALQRLFLAGSYMGAPMHEAAYMAGSRGGSGRRDEIAGVRLGKGWG